MFRSGTTSRQVYVRLDKDLHTTTKTQHEMESRLLLNVVIRKSTTILKLLSGEDQALLVRGNSFLVLNLAFDIVDGVRRLDLKSDRLSGQSLDKNLHATAETQHKMESALLLDIVIRKSAPVLELLSGEDQALLVRRDSFFVLNLGLDIIDRIGGLDLERDGLASEAID
jgi:hypothetical protein